MLKMHSNYHMVTAQPPFIHETMDCAPDWT